MLDPSLKNAHILIVDDQESNILLIENILGRTGYSALRSLTDPRLVLAALDEFQPDMILLDLHMPHLDGFAVLEELKQRVPADDYLPILVLTADVTTQAKLRALAGGARDFLTKPLDVAETTLRVRNLLETRYLHLQQQNQNQILEEKVRQRTAALQRQIQKLDALRTIDAAITGSLDLPRLLDLVLEQTTTQLGVDAASVLLLDPHTQTLTYAAGRGFYTAALHYSRLRLGEGYAGRAALEQGVVYIPDLRQDKGAFLRSTLISGEGFVAYYAVALIVKGHLIGVLEVFQRAPFAADDEWRAFLEMLAGQVAIAVDNASLFAQSQAQAQLTQQIIDSAPAGMLVLDKEQRLTMANPAARAYLPALARLGAGDALTALDGDPLADLLRPTSDAQTRREFSLGQPPRLYEVSAQSLSGGQQAGGWLLLLRDVTEEREAQTRIQQQDRLAAVGRLAAGIAHDFNNVMGTIVLLVQILARTEELSAQNQERVETLIKQAQHASSLIRQILDFSRSSVMQRSAVDLFSLLQEMVKLLQRTLPATITLEVNGAAGECVVDGDSSRLQQVLLNLALNARDAMPAGGLLRFGVERLELQAGESPLPGIEAGHWLRLSVADSGSGIPPAVLSRIFDPFFTTKSPDKGTGLGLAQVYGIIKQHGGEITVASQMGEGTTFTLYLPATLSAAQTAALPLPAAQATKRTARILLVEDQAVLRQATQEMLEISGYQVVAASDGVAALEIFRQDGHAIDLVLSDMVMPKLGGVELLHALQAIRPELKMILTTGYPLQEQDREMLGQRAVHWIQKPFFGTELVEKVQAVLENRSLA